MSTFATPIPSGKTSPAGFLRILGKIFTGSGVIEADALKVTAQTTPDMTVRISGSALNDNAVFIHTDGTFIQAWNDQNATVTIAANSSGVIKTDAIVAYVDMTVGTGESSPVNNLGALKFVVVRRSGTLTGNPTTAEITASAVGSNPYVVLAYVTVANGASSINSGNITDARTRSLLESSNLETLPQGFVTGASLTTNAIKLGYAQVTAPQAGIAASATDLTGLSVTVDVPAGGRDIEIVARCMFSRSGGTAPVSLQVVEGSTVLGASQVFIANTTNAFTNTLITRVSSPSAGSHTYKLNSSVTGGGGTMYADASGNHAFILVKLI